jgi:hypothetical protein
MNSYKQIEVYTGYNENEITSVDAFECAGDLLHAANLVEENIQNGILDDFLDHGQDGTSMVQEFYTGVKVHGKTAIVANGEEHVMLVIPETHPWFNLVDDHLKWNYVTLSRWLTFMDQQLNAC